MRADGPGGLLLAAMLLCATAAAQTPQQPDLVALVRDGSDDALKARLVAKTVDLNAVDAESETLLTRAALWGRTGALRLLLEHGASVHACNRFGETPLHRAAEQGSVENARLLLARGADVNAVDRNRRSPLHSAAYTGHLDVAAVLIQAGAQVDAKDSLGQTPLREAAVSGSTEVFMFLLKQGADPNRYGRRMLSDAIMGGKMEIIGSLFDLGYPINPPEAADSPLLAAAHHGQLELMTLLFERGASLTVRGQFQQTPLHYAVYNHQLRAVRLLLARGADLEARDEDGRTALLAATVYNGSVDMVQLLSEQGAKLDAKDAKGRTAPQIAKEEGNSEVADYFKGLSARKPGKAAARGSGPAAKR